MLKWLTITGLFGTLAAVCLLAGQTAPLSSPKQAIAKTDSSQNQKAKTSSESDNQAAPNIPTITKQPDVGKCDEACQQGRENLKIQGELALFTGLLVAVGMLQIGTMIWQAQLLKGTLKVVESQGKIAREEFNSTHRPKLIVCGFHLMKPELPAGQHVRPVFVAHNIGDTVAKVIEVRSATIILGIGEKIPNNYGVPNPEPFDLSLASGVHEVFPANGGNVISQQDVLNLLAQTHRLFCIGVLSYTDTNGIKRETGFCRRYWTSDRTWEPVESEYEYAY